MAAATVLAAPQPGTTDIWDDGFEFSPEFDMDNAIDTRNLENDELIVVAGEDFNITTEEFGDTSTSPFWEDDDEDGLAVRAAGGDLL